MGELMVRNERGFHLGSVAVAGPEEVVEVAAQAANILADVIRRQGLAVSIRGREYVRVDGWATAAALLGLMAREASVMRHPDGTWEAVVEVVRLRDGAVVGRGSAIVGPDEPTWAERPEYARRSMAITRAAGKAFRLALSWVMCLAGYETTPAEEIEALEVRPTDPSPQAAQEPRVNWSAFWARVKAMGLSPDRAHEILRARTSFTSFKDYIAAHGVEGALRLLEEAVKPTGQEEAP
jgi:hypothetical protein